MACERESKIEKWLNGQIKMLGGKSYKFVSPGNPGVPDRIYLLPDGRVIFAELKADDGKLSAVQKYQIREFNEVGVRVALIVGMQGAKEFIEEL